MSYLPENKPGRYRKCKKISIFRENPRFGRESHVVIFGMSQEVVVRQWYRYMSENVPNRPNETLPNAINVIRGRFRSDPFYGFWLAEDLYLIKRYSRVESLFASEKGGPV